jgi:hypothetical protein
VPSTEMILLAKENRVSKRLSTKSEPSFNQPFRIVGCQAASNLLFMSRKTQKVVSIFLKLPSMRLTSFDPADSVDLPTRKPCWLLFELGFSAGFGE